MSLSNLRDAILADSNCDQWRTDLDPQSIADYLNAPIPDEYIYGEVTQARFVTWTAVRVRAVIEDHAGNSQSPLRSSALSLLDFIRSAGTPIMDLGNAAVMGLVDAWETAKAITSDEKAELLSLGATPKTKARELGFDLVTARDVATALWGNT